MPPTVPLSQVKPVELPPPERVVAVVPPSKPDPSDVPTPVVPVRADLLMSVDLLPDSPPPPPTRAAETPPAPPATGQPRLVVLRGERVDMHYPVFDGANYIGRTDDQPVDIDLVCQESPDRVWASRQHAVIHRKRNELTIEDLNSLNGTFVNRKRISPGKPRVLNPGDVIQIGTVQLRVVV
jgi:hypothetical protein